MKKANFDISHKLDEFSMVEKPLTAQKRKANPDLEKMELESVHIEGQMIMTSDVTRPTRMLYYPHNQPITVAVNVKEGRPGLDPLCLSDTSDPSANHHHNFDSNVVLHPPPSHTNAISEGVKVPTMDTATGTEMGAHGIATHTYWHAGPGGRMTVLAMRCSSSKHVSLLPPTIPNPFAVALEKRTPGVTILD